MNDHCRRGHLFTEANTLPRVKNGKTYQACRECVAMQKRLRYRNNAEFRERKKTTERQRHRDNKELRT